MKRTFSVLMAFVFLISCKKEINTSSAKPIQNKTENISSNLISRQLVDTVPTPLIETSPGVYETSQNYRGAHLIFNNLEVHGGFPYAKLINARAFGSTPGTNLYEIIAEGLMEQGMLQRSFVFKTNSCIPVIKEEKRQISSNSYWALTTYQYDYTFTYENNEYDATGVEFTLEKDNFIEIFEVDFSNPNPKYTSLKVKTGSFSICNVTKLITGKIIARQIPNTYPAMYNYFVAPLGNRNESIFLTEE